MAAKASSKDDYLVLDAIGKGAFGAVYKIMRRSDKKAC